MKINNFKYNCTFNIYLFKSFLYLKLIQKKNIYYKSVILSLCLYVELLFRSSHCDIFTI